MESNNLIKKPIKEQSENYTAIYFPDNQKKLKEETYFTLQDIDANFSKIFQILLPSLLKAANKILLRGKNYRHFIWEIKITERKS